MLLSGTRNSIQRRRRPLLSLLAILISLCIILSYLLWRKLNLRQYFVTTNTRKQIRNDVPIILNFGTEEEEEEEGTKKLQYEEEADTTSRRSSPACKPHFQLALPDGKWSDSIKFKRLYFYHVRKAGVRFFSQSCAPYAHHVLLCTIMLLSLPTISHSNIILTTLFFKLI